VSLTSATSPLYAGNPKASKLPPRSPGAGRRSRTCDGSPPTVPRPRCRDQDARASGRRAAGTTGGKGVPSRSGDHGLDTFHIAQCGATSTNAR
jgi:hypothetical protein